MQTPKPPSPSAEAIRRATAEFQLTVNDEQVQQIQQYIEILLRWNAKMNLTAIHDRLEILYRHFCESMYGAVAIPVLNQNCERRHCVGWKRELVGDCYRRSGKAIEPSRAVKG